MILNFADKRFVLFLNLRRYILKVFEIIKSIIYVIKELDKAECCGNDMCQLSQKELMEIGNKSFKKQNIKYQKENK